MIKKKSVVGYVIFFIIVLILIKYSDYSSRKNCERHIKDLKFNGVIIKKYIDSKQHNYEILELNTINDSLQKINLTNDQSGLFKYVQENDSIIKISGDLKVEVYRNSIDTIFVLDKLCL